MAYIDSANIKGTLYDIHDTAARDMIAPAYSTASAYAVGDYVTYNDKLYRCAVAIASGEVWTAAHWTAVDVGGEVGDLKSATTALETYVRDMSPVAYGNDEGIPVPIVTVRDAAPLNAEDVFFEVEPVQDLHGYDHPWPAGGGKNLLPPDKYQPSSTLVVLGQTDNTTFNLHLKAGTYTVSLTTTTLGSFYYRASDGTENIHIGGYFVTSATFTLESDSDIRLWYYTSAEIDESEISNTMLELGSAATSYVPYSNICPITGWTGAEVYRTGKNLFDGMIQQGQINSNGENASSNTRIRCVGYIPVKPNMVYTLSRSVSTDALTVRMYDAKKEFLGVGGSQYFKIIPGKGYSSVQPMIHGYTTCSFTFGDGVAYFRFQDQSNDLTAKYQLEVGSTATDYEPYQGDVLDITFPTEAGTVYGGTVDLTRGKLVVDRGYIASYDGETLPGAWISGMDVYAPGTTPTTGAQVVYTLASTAEYDLTPQEIEMFKGVNNLWANTGDISVQYRQDVYTALNNKINELQALVLES